MEKEKKVDGSFNSWKQKVIIVLNIDKNLNSK
jgi:hypothetical protein